MKKYIVTLGATIMIAALAAGCSASQPTTATPAPTPSVTAEPAPTPSEVVEVTPTPSAVPTMSPADTTDKIAVSMEFDEVLSQAIVTVENNSDYIFSGDIYVSFKDGDGTLCDNDTIFVEDLAPGNWTYARTNVDAAWPVTMEYKITDGAEFTESVVSADDWQLDEAASASLAEEFEGSFGGAGNPEWATSWYHYATAIAVYNGESGNKAVITVSADTPQDASDRIGNTIFANYSDDFGLVLVTVQMEDGSEVFTRAA